MDVRGGECPVTADDVRAENRPSAENERTNVPNDDTRSLPDGGAEISR